jgi:hypothetical protein
MTMATKWVERWRDVIADEPEMPGVWRRRDGGFHVRGRATDPRTGKLREINWALPQMSKAREAYAWLHAELDKVKAGTPTADQAPPTFPRFHEHCANVFAHKVAIGKIRSAAGSAKWGSALNRWILPRFGDYYVDQMAPVLFKTWQAELAALIKAGKMAPSTANTLYGVLKQCTDALVDEYDIRDPLRGVEQFDMREHATYTEEEPNSLAPADVPRFLDKMRELHPDHYAFVFLGITTGLRPSSLRPLRRDGESADIKWKDGLLLIRRSQTIGNVVMETTKTDLHQRLALPPEVLDVLRWHINERLLPKKMRESDLLFPATTGGFRARSVLDKPFEEVCEAIKLPYRLTPRGMRRTYQDLARAAGVHDAVTRAISGHATPAMQLHYSTARGDEVRAALANIAGIATGAKIIDLADARRTRTRKPRREATARSAASS